jgi:hypothetical protein
LEKLKLGIIGMSEGNGHPYSWSAIFNGYDDDEMRSNEYPGIHQYLSKQTFPQDSIHDATVTHIWTQSSEISHKISRASLIPHVANQPEDMIGHIDALLLARDDAENHKKFAEPFLQKGIPVYIDKPLAYTEATARELLSIQQYEGQIFTCSALRYAKEFSPGLVDSDTIGNIISVEANVPKSWEKYAIHVIEPLLQLLPFEVNDIKKKFCFKTPYQTKLAFTTSQDKLITISANGKYYSDFSISFRGSKGVQTMVFKDSFNAFKSALIAFIDGVKNKGSLPIERKSTLNCIRLIEMGLHAN